MTTTQRHIGGALALMFATIFGTAWADATPHAGTADAPYADTVIGSAPAGALPATVTISDASLTEGDAGVAAMTFTLTRSNNTGSFNVLVTTVPGTATSPADLQAITGPLAFAAGGSLTQIVQIGIVGETLVEGTETFTVVLSNPTNGNTITDDTGVGTILDNDFAFVTFNPTTVSQLEATTPMAFTVTISNPVQAGLSVNVNTVNGTAVAPGDYTAIVNGTVTFPPNSSAPQTVNVPIFNDAVVEPDESFQLVIAPPIPMAEHNIIFGNPTATGTIQNDDVPGVNLTIADASVAEGSGGGTTNLLFQVTLSGPAPGNDSIPFTVTPGTAANPADYTTAAGNVLTTVGSTTATATVVVIADNLDENNETLNVTVGTPPPGYNITDGSALGTINDDDAPPVISVSSPSANEGDTGSTPLNFVVTLSAPSSFDVNFTRATVDGGATVANSDYTALPSATGTILAGQTALAIPVQVTGDSLVEPNESFTLNITGVTNATPASITGTGTITNDDIGVSIAAASVVEGSSGTVNLVFPVTLTSAPGTSTTIPFTVTPGTAATPADYTTTSGNIAITAGSTSATATVVVVSDTVDESDETLNVAIGTPPPGYQVTNGTAVGTIIDDDSTINVAIGDGSQLEGNGAGTMTFTVTLNVAAPAGGTLVDFQTFDGTANGGSDYVATSGTLTIPAGQTTGTISVQIIGDTTLEAEETFIVRLTNARNATPAGGSVNYVITDNEGVGTLGNDDPATPVPTLDPRRLMLLLIMVALVGAVALRTRK